MACFLHFKWFLLALLFLILMFMLSLKNITSSLACSTKSVTILAQWVLLWLFLNKWRCNLTWHELSRVILRGHTKSILIYGRQFDVSKAFLWCVWPFIRVRTFFLWKIPQIWPSVMTVQSKQAVQVKNGQPKCRKEKKYFFWILIQCKSKIIS